MAWSKKTQIQGQLKMLSSLILFTFCQKNEFTLGSDPAASQCTVCAMVGIHSLVLGWSKQFHQILNSPAGHRWAVWEDQTGEQGKRTPERWPRPLLHQPLRHTGPEKHQPVPGEGADAGGGWIHWLRQGGLKKKLAGKRSLQDALSGAKCPYSSAELSGNTFLLLWLL